VRLNVEPAAREVQPIAVGIDPGSKREGYSVLGAAHTYLNIQAEARDGVKKAEEHSTRQRRTRRGRKTPCRKPRQNRQQSKKKLPPSTKARGPRKLRLARFLCQLFPVRVFVVEDIKARTQGKRRWDQQFSPLEVGKHWFYAELGKLAPVVTRQGYDTSTLRDQLGFKKISKKLAEVWEAHCVDAWVLAYSAVGGTMESKLSLHDAQTGKRLTQMARVSDCQPIKLLRWRTWLVPLVPIPTSPAPKKEDLLPPLPPKTGVSASRVQ